MGSRNSGLISLQGLVVLAGRNPTSTSGGPGGDIRHVVRQYLPMCPQEPPRITLFLLLPASSTQASPFIGAPS